LNQKFLTEQRSSLASLLRFCPVCKGSGDGNGLGLCPACGGKGHIVERNPYALFWNSPWISQLLESAIQATCADFGNVQLVDPSQHALRIVAHHGFGKEFLEYFKAVSSGEFCCGAALKKRSRVVVSDVASDPLFRDGVCKGVMLRAKARSCQSSPLVDGTGRLVGVVSTHFNRPQEFSPTFWRPLDRVIDNFYGEFR
jgi:hypothetical protein